MLGYKRDAGARITFSWRFYSLERAEREFLKRKKLFSFMNLEKLTSLYHNSFNPKFAWISAACNGPIAGYVNYDHGLEEAIAATLTQAAASFLSTGITARLVQHFSPIQSPWISYSLGSVVPGTVTFLMSFGWHYFSETPELFESCIAPMLISLTTALGTNYITRRGYMLPNNYLRKE